MIVSPVSIHIYLSHWLQSVQPRDARNIFCLLKLLRFVFTPATSGITPRSSSLRSEKHLILLDDLMWRGFVCFSRLTETTFSSSAQTNTLNWSAVDGSWSFLFLFVFNYLTAAAFATHLNTFPNTIPTSRIQFLLTKTKRKDFCLNWIFYETIIPDNFIFKYL